ncbi:leader peptidase (prepilin peptidase) / N-methyltransferase [Gracilibacillus ureilyticus]|uniref:Leader peptidase (Prepilin peptidase) / N-methyltransferase n=1 Tax=Gracilibacillus ureilyticus TaxID=531814 RepID=A0A1H9VIT2_9BACI|nr:prepilin peptidase [Gracilibacillus ureilyticus]SES21459.1 leader peptidase (prepilin peptidase) / N-methyltransferase [Gracilibacillus ureilyticus]
MAVVLFIVPIAIILVISTFTDLKSRRIYNWLTFPGMIYFGLYHLVFNLQNIFTYILGFLLVGGICFLIAMFSNSLGGGDIKLLALLGLAFGINAGFYILLYSYLLTAVIAVPILILKKINPDKMYIKEIPMAPFIALGTFIVYIA